MPYRSRSSECRGKAYHANLQPPADSPRPLDGGREPQPKAPPLTLIHMCGRFVSSSSPERIAEYFGAESNVETLGENFNVAPTNDIYGVVETPDGTLERAGVPLGI